ncbi:uncharacterized protein METZ01_LOCUS194261 [marine metagenome]|uniref:Uncharacterized protein n=1 Tax=marine metagenome TaxID=408172 RepID=A0A382DV32_9ZZZZ
MLSCEIYAIIYPVSERNTTNMTMTEIRRFMDAKRKREAKRETNWQKLIDEVLEEGMDLVWNEKTEKYEKKDEVCT